MISHRKYLATFRGPSSLPMRKLISVSLLSGCRLRRVANGGELLFGRPNQLVPLALPLGGEQRVPAYDEPFARIIRMRDLSQIPLVEQR